MWDNTCNYKADENCSKHGYMTNDEISHMDVFNITSSSNLKIGFINIFALKKYLGHPDAEEDHFELVVTSVENRMLAKFKHSGAAWVIILILIISVIGIGISIYYYKMKKI